MRFEDVLRRWQQDHYNCVSQSGKVTVVTKPPQKSHSSFRVDGKFHDISVDISAGDCFVSVHWALGWPPRHSTATARARSTRLKAHTRPTDRLLPTTTHHRRPTECRTNGLGRSPRSPRCRVACVSMRRYLIFPAS